MSSKVEIYNITLSALLLSRQVVDTETDKTNEVKVLNTFWDTALSSTLQDLDLDSTVQDVTLELIESLENEEWNFVYKYPSDCAFLRRISSGHNVDNESTHIPKKISLRDNKKVIYTDKENAVGKCIMKDLPLSYLSPMTSLALAYRLALLSAPLLVGKGAMKLQEKLNLQYIQAKIEAQETDNKENFNYEASWLRSDFVRTRLS